MANITTCFEDFPYVCRICLMKKDNLKLMDPGFLIILKDITHINLNSDDLPQNICNECVNKLEYISSFINSCIKSETDLRTILENHKNELHSQCDDLLEESFSPEDFKVNLFKKSETNENIVTSVAKIKLGPEETLENVLTKSESLHCQVCGEYFVTGTKLYEHKKRHVSCQTRQYKCTNCDKAFFTNFRLKLHMRSHTKEMPYECKICLKKFRFASNVYRHVDVVHKGLKPFKCDICGKEFSRLERKIQHNNVHNNKCPYKCKFCGKTFKHRSTHRNHEMDHKIKNGEIKDLSEIKCNICKKIFSSKSLLQTHFEIHNGERNFLCSICGKDFLKKSYLDIHARIHTEEKPFQCKECGKRFKHASSYKTHSLLHTGLRCFKCDICLKTFKQSSHLKTHFKIHSGEKTFKCSICGKDFYQKSNLNAHTRIHTGEILYHCEICNKGFYDSSSMKKHKKAHITT